MLKGVIKLNKFINVQKKSKLLYMKLQYISFREISPYFTIPNDLVHILALLLRRKEYPLPKNIFSRIIENTGYDRTKPSIF